MPEQKAIIDHKQFDDELDHVDYMKNDMIIDTNRSNISQYNNDLLDNDDLVDVLQDLDGGKRLPSKKSDIIQFNKSFDSSFGPSSLKNIQMNNVAKKNLDDDDDMYDGSFIEENHMDSIFKAKFESKKEIEEKKMPQKKFIEDEIHEKKMPEKKFIEEEIHEKKVFAPLVFKNSDPPLNDSGSFGKDDAIKQMSEDDSLPVIVTAYEVVGHDEVPDKKEQDSKPKAQDLDRIIKSQRSDFNDGFGKEMESLTQSMTKNKWNKLNRINKH